MNWFRRYGQYFLLGKVIIALGFTALSSYYLWEQIKAIDEWRASHPCVEFSPGGWCKREGIYD